MFERGAGRLTRGRVPQARRVVLASGHHLAPAGLNAALITEAVMALDALDQSGEWKLYWRSRLRPTG